MIDGPGEEAFIEVVKWTISGLLGIVSLTALILARAIRKVREDQDRMHLAFLHQLRRESVTVEITRRYLYKITRHLDDIIDTSGLFETERQEYNALRESYWKALGLPVYSVHHRTSVTSLGPSVEDRLNKLEEERRKHSKAGA